MIVTIFSGLATAYLGWSLLGRLLSRPVLRIMRFLGPKDGAESPRVAATAVPYLVAAALLAVLGTVVAPIEGTAVGVSLIILAVLWFFL